MHDSKQKKNNPRSGQRPPAEWPLSAQFDLMAALADVIAQRKNDARDDENQMNDNVPGQVAVRGLNRSRGRSGKHSAVM
jgi:hypothetical protein